MVGLDVLRDFFPAKMILWFKMQWPISPFSPPVLSGFPMEVFPNSCSYSVRAQITFPRGLNSPGLL